MAPLENICNQTPIHTNHNIRNHATVQATDIDIDIFVNCSWVDTHWQKYSTHLQTNNTQNNTINLGRVWTVPRLCELYPGIFLTTKEKAWKNLSQGSRRVPVNACFSTNENHFHHSVKLPTIMCTIH